MVAEVNLHDADRTINKIRHDYQHEWEDEDAQRSCRAVDEQRGQRDAGVKANPDLFRDGDLPNYFGVLVAGAVDFITKTDRFSSLGKICRLIKSRIGAIEQDIRKVLDDAGLSKESEYEWAHLRTKLQQRKAQLLQETLDKARSDHRTKEQELSEAIEDSKVNLREYSGKQNPISDEELRSYETRNNLMRATFYAALTAFVLAEAFVNGVGFEGMGFDPAVALVAAGLLGGFLFWSAHLLGSYIKQSVFYAKDERNKRRVFTLLFVIIALSIFLFFTDTRHDYLTQLQQQETAIDLLGDGSGATEPASVPYGAYDYVFMFVNMLIYFLGLFVSWLISPKSKELKKLYLERARNEQAYRKQADRTREDGKRTIETELQQLQGKLDGWSKEKAELEFKLSECLNFYQETVTNLARAVHRRLGQYVDAYQVAAQEQFPGRRVTVEFVRQRIQEGAPLIGQAVAVELPDEAVRDAAPAHEPSDNVTTIKAS